MNNSANYDYSGARVLVTGGTSVIGVASLMSYFANELVPGSGAVEAGLVQMAKSMGLIWAEHGIRANNIAAGLTDTRMTGFMRDMPEFTTQLLNAPRCAC